MVQQLQQHQINIDLKSHLNDVRDMYRNSASRNTVNVLIIGDYGEGKTYGMRHARAPVLIHSFDPGGAKNLKKYVEEGRVIVDSRYEEEDPTSPVTYRLWEHEFRTLYDSGAFNQIGTFVLDSLTSMSEALMNEILKANGRAPKKGKASFESKSTTLAIPQLRDYQIQMATILQQLQLCCSLPCDFVALAHLKYDKDDTTGRMFAGPLLTGKLAQKVPMLFDEIYITSVKTGQDGAVFQYTTQPDGVRKGRTRMGADGVFDKFEEQNLREMLKKAGYDITDKPLFI